MLSYGQAKEQAEAWFKRKNQQESDDIIVDDNYTVAHAMQDYIQYRETKKA